MSNQMQDKFGKVFVLKHGTETKEYQILEGAKFSNMNFQVTKEGSQGEMFKGKRFHVRVLGVRFKIPLPLGMNVKPDMEILQLGLDKDIAMAKKMKIVSENDKGEFLERKLEMMRNSGTSLYYGCIIPSSEWVEHDFLFVAGIYSQLDGVLEAFGNGQGAQLDRKKNDRQKCTYRVLSQIADIISDLLQAGSSEMFGKLTKDPLQLLQMACGKCTSSTPVFAKYKQDHLDAVHAMLQQIINYISSLRSTAISIGLENDCSAEGFLNQTGLAVKMCSLQFSREWLHQIMSDENAKLMLPVMVALRQTSVCANYYIQSVLLAQGIHLGNKLRETSLFKLIYDKICSHTQKMNDVFSFEKEIYGKAEEWRNNEACILHKFSGMSKSAALAKVAERANLDLDQMETLSDLLIETWKETPEHQHVEDFVVVLKRHVAAHLRWGAVRNYYHKGLIMDCYIDEI